MDEHDQPSEPVEDTPPSYEAVPEAKVLEPEPELPGLLTRLVWVFFSPGRLMEALAKKPAWGASLVVSCGLLAAGVALIPIDIVMEASRQAAIDAGRDPQEMGDGVLQVMRFVIPMTTFVSTMIISFLSAGLYTVVFAFVLGDEGTYRQYLAALTHAMFIAAFVGLLLTPLRIMSGDAQLTLNLGLFMPFLPEGYFQSFFRFLDITQIWSTLVVAQGAHVFDSRRSFGSAATIMLIITVIFVGAIAFFL